jgi:hypothetical protein
VTWAARLFVALIAVLDASPSIAGTLTGTVTWTSTRAFAPIVIARDRHVCGQGGPIYDGTAVYDRARRVEQAVVYLEDARPADYVPFREVVFDQRNCQFVPHVAASTRGSLLRFRSSDPVLHNVRVTEETGKTIANWAMPVMDQEVSVKPTSPGVFRVGCGAHSWMHAWVRVFEHPYFDVTGSPGRYEIAQVPPGEHRLVAWHPDIGKVAKVVIMPEDPRARVVVNLSFP